MLQKDGLSPNAKIANKVGVSEETVRRRVKRMLKDDYLRVVAVPNTEKMGFSSQVLIGLQVIPEKMDLVAERLSNIPEVRWLSVTTGSFDIFNTFLTLSNGILSFFDSSSGVASLPNSLKINL